MIIKQAFAHNINTVTIIYIKKKQKYHETINVQYVLMKNYIHRRSNNNSEISITLIHKVRNLINMCDN